MYTIQGDEGINPFYVLMGVNMHSACLMPWRSESQDPLSPTTGLAKFTTTRDATQPQRINRTRPVTDNPASGAYV